MSKKLQVSIATPCHENWDSMTPVQQGKFCGSCQKQVVDFTGMSDRQIAEFFKKPSTGSVCGRFMTDQLEREIDIPRKRIPWLKYFFTIALPALFISKSSAQRKMGIVARPQIKDTAKVATVPQVEIMGNIMVPAIREVRDGITPEVLKTMDPYERDAYEKGLKGYVTDAASGEPLAGAVITMKTSVGNEKYMTNREGLFVLNVIRKISFYGIEISAPGYETKEIPYGQFKRTVDGRLIFALEKIPVITNREFLIGDVDISCTILTGDTLVAYTAFEAKGNTISGRVVDEAGEPIPFASIESGKKGEGVMADENGFFSIKTNWLKKGKSLQVSSAGFEESKILAGEEIYEDGILVVQLKANKPLPEVVLTSYQAIGCRMTTGLVSTIKGEVTSVIRKTETPITKTETPLPMEEPKLLVYPNPVASGSAVNLSFKKMEEGYYQLQIISQARQLMLQKEIWIDAEARLLNLELPAVAAGTYFVVLANTVTGKKYSQKIIVQ